MTTVEEFRRQVAETPRICTGSPLFAAFHAYSQEALKITSELNGRYHAPEEVRALMEELIGAPLDDRFGLFPPFHTDCGKNTRIGKRVFINSGCQFQDQGGLTIGDDVLVGPGTIVATLNHAEDPEHRSDLIPAPVKIGNKVWIGARVTICPGVTIGEGSIIGAGAVVTRSIPPFVLAAGVPAKVLREIRQDQP